MREPWFPRYNEIIRNISLQLSRSFLCFGDSTAHRPGRPWTRPPLNAVLSFKTAKAGTWDSLLYYGQESSHHGEHPLYFREHFLHYGEHLLYYGEHISPNSFPAKGVLVVWMEGLAVVGHSHTAKEGRAFAAICMTWRHLPSKAFRRIYEKNRFLHFSLVVLQFMAPDEPRWFPMSRDDELQWS